jgi:hypothetical protein
MLDNFIAMLPLYEYLMLEHDLNNDSEKEQVYMTLLSLWELLRVWEEETSYADVVGQFAHIRDYLLQPGRGSGLLVFTSDGDMESTYTQAVTFPDGLVVYHEYDSQTDTLIRIRLGDNPKIRNPFKPSVFRKIIQQLDIVVPKWGLRQLVLWAEKLTYQVPKGDTSVICEAIVAAA